MDNVVRGWLFSVMDLVLGISSLLVSLSRVDLLVLFGLMRVMISFVFVLSDVGLSVNVFLY